MKQIYLWINSRRANASWLAQASSPTIQLKIDCCCCAWWAGPFFLSFLHSAAINQTFWLNCFAELKRKRRKGSQPLRGKWKHSIWFHNQISFIHSLGAASAVSIHFDWFRPFGRAEIKSKLNCWMACGPPNSFLSFIQQLISLISLIPSIIFMNFRNKLVGLYCYNIFLLHFSFIQQWMKQNEEKIKVLLLFLRNEVEWMVEWVAAPFIEEFHSSNYGVVGYMFSAQQPIHSFSLHSSINH